MAGAWRYQDLVTVLGTRYDFSFWYAPGRLASGYDPSTVELQAFWNGTQVQDIVGVGSNPDGTYTQYTATGLLASTGATTQIEFLGRQDCCYNGLDDVSVDISAVPEPATFTLVGFGLVAGGLVRRRFSL